MCIFAANVSAVRSTCIFAARAAEVQTLVYDAYVSTKEGNAMILPVPVVAGRADSIAFIDLSSRPTLFTELDWLFGFLPNASFIGAPQTIAVERVGAFEASVVPRISDFDRLDARLRLAPHLVDTLADRYVDHAFVVYRFAPGDGALHPFAFSFASRYADRLFFPTLHVHDGEGAPATAPFDHVFYAQGAKLEERATEPLASAIARTFPRGWSAPAFLALDRPLDYARVVGERANEDTFALLD